MPHDEGGTERRQRIINHSIDDCGFGAEQFRRLLLASY